MLELHFLFSVPTLSRSTVYCTERINGTASEFISPFLSGFVFSLHMWTLACHSVVFPLRLSGETHPQLLIHFSCIINYHITE